MAAVLITLGLSLILHRRASATRTTDSHRAYGSCQQTTICIPATADSAVYDIPTVNNDIEAAAWAIRDATRTTPHGLESIIRNSSISGNFNIHVQLCTPYALGDQDVLQIATHGVHADSRYWDSEYQPEKQSYVEYALQSGYPILTYDRLGVGRSDILDAYTEVQGPLELEILRQLTLMARNGTLYEIFDTSSDPVVAKADKPNKVVHVGHNFGSFLTCALIAKYGNLSDGAILTGYLMNEYFGTAGATSWAVQAPSSSIPRFDRPSGYAVCTKVGYQNVFFGGDPSSAFTPALLDYGNTIKQPFPIGELASAFWLVGIPGPSFVGPLQYFLPENDFYGCRGDCNGLANMTELAQTWPNAAAIEVAIQPNTGHALTLHNNATAGFGVMVDFLKRHNL